MIRDPLADSTPRKACKTPQDYDSFIDKCKRRSYEQGFGNQQPWHTNGLELVPA